MVTTTGFFQRANSPPASRLLFLAVFIVMVPVTAVLVYLFSLRNVASFTVDECTEKYGPVVGITLMHRHGARTIDHQYPKDPYHDLKYWPEGIGELTKEGIIQQFQQGQWIASQYKHLIPSSYLGIHNGIHVVSTNWNRTIMSAEAELAGMFLIHSSKNSWYGLQSYLVPIHSIPEDEDALLEVTKACPRLDALLKKNIQSDKYQRILKDNQEVANIIKTNLGGIMVDLDSYQQLYSVLTIEKGRGHTLGKWADAVYPSPLRELSTISFAAPTWTRDLKRLRGGPFIKEVIANVRRKANNPRFRNVSIYSAHDTSISAFLNSMNDMFQEETLGPPNFSALVIVEHRQNGSTNHVRILYRCPYPKEISPDCHFKPRVLTIPGCDEVCPFEKMVELLRDVTPDDWEAECRNTADLEAPITSVSGDPSNSSSSNIFAQQFSTKRRKTSTRSEDVDYLISPA